MGYTVIQRFVDLQDHNHRYEVGDVFPHLNANVSQSRIDELASNKNRRKIPLIEKVQEVVNKPVSEFMNTPDESSDEEQSYKPKRRKGKKNATIT